jgi:hypothetical protein
MITFAPKELMLWVKTPIGTGILLYVRSLQQDNDEWTVMLENGDVKHFQTNQIKIVKNMTVGINMKDESPSDPHLPKKT